MLQWPGYNGQILSCDPNATCMPHAIVPRIQTHVPLGHAMVCSCDVDTAELQRTLWSNILSTDSNWKRLYVSLKRMHVMRSVKSVEGLAEDCAIMFAMLADDAAVRDVFAAVLRGEPPCGAIFADMSTVLPSTTAELAAAAADKGALIAGAEQFP